MMDKVENKERNTILFISQGKIGLLYHGHMSVCVSDSS
jgi:hypothetical protein